MNVNLKRTRAKPRTFTFAIPSLAPAEGLLDQLAFALANFVARVSRRAAVDGAAFSAIYWIAQDRTRCLLVPDFLQVILCDYELIASLSFKKGQFQGPLDVWFMSVQSGDGYLVEMVQLLKPFSYRDSNGVLWDVPEGIL